MLEPETIYPHVYKKNVHKIIYLKHFIRNPNIKVGDYTRYNHCSYPEKFEHINVRGGFLSKLNIGKFCQIAMGTTFILSDMNYPTHAFSTFRFSHLLEQSNHNLEIILSDTNIGNDVWFGTNSVIMPGVHIGDGAIIGAFSVVTENVEPYSIVSGNPAKVIRKRFSDNIIADLLEIKWWDWDHDKITKNVKAIAGRNIEELKKSAI